MVSTYLFPYGYPHTHLLLSPLGLFWGGVPSLNASIAETGSWQAIHGATLLVQLASERATLITYELGVEGLRRIDGSPLPREGHTDALQVRCLIDGVPLRYSSSFASTYLVEQRMFSSASSSFAANLSSGQHTVALQWKKTGSQIERWSVQTVGPNSQFSISAQADFDMLDYAHESNDQVLYTADAWKPMSDSMVFTVDRQRSVTVGYAATAQPQLLSFIKDRTMEYITSRLVIDGTPLLESAETFGTNGWNPCAHVLKGSVRVDLAPGAHAAQLQWRKRGSVFKSWGSSPSAMDGFASSRNLYVLMEKYATPTFVDHERHLLPPQGGWTTVGGTANVLSFSLVKESAVLLRYGLPVTQYGNPSLDANVWAPLAQVDARLVVDGNAQPTITSPAMVAGLEDALLVILGVRVDDVDAQLEGGVVMDVNITLATGTLSFPNAPLLFSFAGSLGPGGTIRMTDSIANINLALLNLTYTPPERWSGTDSIQISISDQQFTGYGTFKTSQSTIKVTINPVDNPFTLTATPFQGVPSDIPSILNQVLLEDVDSQGNFRVQLSASCGYLSLPTSDLSITFYRGDGINDSAVDFQAPYSTVKEVLLAITYTPQSSCSQKVHQEVVSVRVVDALNLSHDLTRLINLQLVGENIAPEILAEAFPRFRVAGLTLKAGISGDSLGDSVARVSKAEIKYTQLPAGVTVSLSFGEQATNSVPITTAPTDLPITTSLELTTSVPSGLGGGFVPSASVQCLFGGVGVDARVLSSSAIECLTPPSVVGSVQVGVSVEGYQSTLVEFTFISPPSLTSLCPNSGSSLGGTNVTIAGAGFASSPDVQCHFGTSATPASVLSDSLLRCVSEA
ncbi:hypothetical protein B484DRAFT_327005, partial [Ochromonadaceae sp. CCMP2298]